MTKKEAGSVDDDATRILFLPKLYMELSDDVFMVATVGSGNLADLPRPTRSG
jgi:hypothetical protein